MSAPEHNGEQVEQKCSIKVTRNAKGEAQWEAKVVEGFDPTELERVRLAAVELHRSLQRDLG